MPFLLHASLENYFEGESVREVRRYWPVYARQERVESRAHNLEIPLVLGGNGNLPRIPFCGIRRSGG